MIDSMSHDMTVSELVGWMRAGDKRERGSYPKDKHWQAGWLAAHVWHESHMEPYSAWARSLDMSKLPKLSTRERRG